MNLDICKNCKRNCYLFYMKYMDFGESIKEEIFCTKYHDLLFHIIFNPIIEYKYANGEFKLGNDFEYNVKLHGETKDYLINFFNNHNPPEDCVFYTEHELSDWNNKK